MPARGQGAGFRLAIADDAGHQQVGIVECRAIRMRQRITELAAFVDGARRLRRRVAGNAAGKGKLREQLLHSRLVLRDVRVQLAVGALQIGVGHQTRSAVAGPGDIDHVEVILRDDPVEVHIDEVQSRRGTPVAQQPRLHMFELQRILQQRVVVEVNLADRQIVGGPPIGVHLPQQIAGEGLLRQLSLSRVHGPISLPVQS